nr:MAG TPA: hypothetical protein [Caudoviricetes sp.]
MRTYDNYSDLMYVIDNDDIAPIEAVLYVNNICYGNKVTALQYKSFKNFLKFVDIDEKPVFQIYHGGDIQGIAIKLKNYYQDSHNFGYIDSMAEEMEKTLFGHAYLAACKQHKLDPNDNGYFDCAIPSAEEIFSIFKKVLERAIQKADRPAYRLRLKTPLMGLK